VNDGGATAAEMLELIDKIKATARATGIELEIEVQIGRAGVKKGDPIPKKVAVLMGAQAQNATSARDGSRWAARPFVRPRRQRSMSTMNTLSCPPTSSRLSQYTAPSERTVSCNEFWNNAASYTGDGVEASATAFDKSDQKRNFASRA
jgi:hypothetical protein